MKRVLSLVLFVAVALAVFPQKVHVVVKGDCLWDLAGYYYNNPFIWRNIYNANMDKIKDPHWIYPGQEFIIPDVPADQAVSPAEEPVEETAVQETAAEDVQEDVYVEKEMPTEQITYTKSADEENIKDIKTIREDIKKIEQQKSVKISNAIDYAVAKELAFRSGYIDAVNPQIGKVSGLYKESYSMTKHEKIYIKLSAPQEELVGKELIIYEWSNKISDKGGSGYLGKHINILGTVKIDGYEGDLAYGTITSSYGVISKNNFVAFYSDPFVPLNNAYLKEPQDIRSKLIGKIDPKTRINEYTIVFINSGKNGKINSGDVFTVIRKDKAGHYYAAGALQVLVPYDNYSTATMLSIKGNTDLSTDEELKLAYRNKNSYIMNKYSEITGIESQNVEQQTVQPLIINEEPVTEMKEEVTIEETVQQPAVSKPVVKEEVQPVVEEPIVEEKPVQQPIVEEPLPTVEEESVKQDNTGFIIEEPKDTAQDTTSVMGQDEIIIIEEE